MSAVRSRREPAPSLYREEFDHTDLRIRAYLARVVPLEGISVSHEYHRGRSLIERMALSAIGDGPPRLQLCLADCADVLEFMRSSEPGVQTNIWLRDPPDAPSHQVGWRLVLDAVMSALRTHSKS